MKALIIVFLLLKISPYSFCQNELNPEDIIINIKGGSNEILDKKVLSGDPDSVHMGLIDEVKPRFITKLDSNSIKKNIVGKWCYSLSRRTNGIINEYDSKEIYEFKEDGTFSNYILGNDTISGKWELYNYEKGEIILRFSKPYEYFKTIPRYESFDEQMKKSLTFENNIITINNISEHELSLINVLTITPIIDDIYYRIYFNIYSRE